LVQIFHLKRSFITLVQKQIIGMTPTAHIPNIQASLIDLDGTLIDTLPDFAVALNAMLTDLALPKISTHWIAQTVGKGSEHLIRSLLTHVGAADQFDEGWQRYQHHYGRINGEHARLFPGVLNGLQHMQARGWRLICVTNKPDIFVPSLLQKMGIADFFEHAFGGNAFAKRKPDPLPLLEACKRLGTAPEHTLMIGDSRNDAQAAHAAGCPVVLVTYGYNHGEPIRKVAAQAYVASLDGAEFGGLFETGLA
jgi:phosphoglycolate phosphatase